MSVETLGLLSEADILRLDDRHLRTPSSRFNCHPVWDSGVMADAVGGSGAKYV